MKYLITGGSSFWGSEIIYYIHEKDRDACIIATYNRHLKPHPDAVVPDTNDLSTIGSKSGIWYLKCDVRNNAEVRALKTDYNYIIHLAGVVKHTNYGIDEMMDTNVHGTSYFLDLADTIKSEYNIKPVFIFASSSGVVGCSRTPGIGALEDSKLSEVSKNMPYYCSKMLGEVLCDTYRRNGLDIIILRPPMILGGGDPSGRATKIIRDYFTNYLTFITGGTICFCDVLDLVRITYDVMHDPEHRGIYNIPGHSMSIREFYERLQRIYEANYTGGGNLHLYIPYYPSWFIIRGYEGIRGLLGYDQSVSPSSIRIEMANLHWTSISKYLSADNMIPPDVTLTSTLTEIVNDIVFEDINL